MVDHVMLKEGVANFKLFKERGNKFFDRFEAKADADEESEMRAAKKQWKRSDKIAVAAIVAVCLLAPMGYVADKTVVFFSDLYQITQEWHAVHHGEIQQKKSFFVPDPVITYMQKPSQDAQVPRQP